MTSGGNSACSGLEGSPPFSIEPIELLAGGSRKLPDACYGSTVTIVLCVSSFLFSASSTDDFDPRSVRTTAVEYRDPDKLRQSQTGM